MNNQIEITYEGNLRTSIGLEMRNAVLEFAFNHYFGLDDADGEKVLEGAEAFLLVWKKIPKYKFLYKFFKLPIIFNIFSFIYEIVAFFLYLKNKKQLKN